MRTIMFFLAVLSPFQAFAMHGGGYSPAEWRTQYEMSQRRLSNMEAILGQYLGGTVKITEAHEPWWVPFFSPVNRKLRLHADLTVGEATYKVRCEAFDDGYAGKLEVDTRGCAWVSEDGRVPAQSFAADNLILSAGSK